MATAGSVNVEITANALPAERALAKLEKAMRACNDANPAGMIPGPNYASPDLLRYEQIGEADNLRGRVVRAFFFVMRLWPTR